MHKEFLRKQSDFALRFSGSLRKRFGVPKDKKVYAALVMGYPAYRFVNTVYRKKPEVQWL